MQAEFAKATVNVNIWAILQPLFTPHSSQKQFATAYIRNAFLQCSHISTSQSLHPCWWGLVSLQHQHLPAATRRSVLSSKHELSSKQELSSKHSQEWTLKHELSSNTLKQTRSTNKNSQAWTLNADSQARPRKSKDYRELFHHDDDKHFSILQRVVFLLYACTLYACVM